MSERGVIYCGLSLFLAAGSFPLWYSHLAGGKKTRPALQLPSRAGNCVESKEYMAGQHMTLLNEWRDAVVREGKTSYTSRTSGEKFEMSLAKTCLGCHEDRSVFCDRCHTYANVEPYCWDCHSGSKGATQQ